jgi:hypothetical protein
MRWCDHHDVSYVLGLATRLGSGKIRRPLGV